MLLRQSGANTEVALSSVALTLVGACQTTPTAHTLHISMATQQALVQPVCSRASAQPFAPRGGVVIGDQEGTVVVLTSRATVLIRLDGTLPHACPM
jgi:hypothetical protein